jgi:hypothetical protein
MLRSSLSEEAGTARCALKLHLFEQFELFHTYLVLFLIDYVTHHEG